MKNKFHLFLLMVTFLFTSCDENRIDENKISSQNIATVPTDKRAFTRMPPPSKKYHLNFISLDKELTILEIEKNIYDFSNILQPIILVNFFSTWCPPCRGQIPHLNNLQKSYKDKLFIMGLLVHDDIVSQELNSCIALRKVNYYISQSKESNHQFAKILSQKLGLKSDFELPMMVMFVYGEYYTHYEGTVPEEMIESDIKQALKEIEG